VLGRLGDHPSTTVILGLVPWIHRTTHSVGSAWSAHVSREFAFYVYILASHEYGTLYVGMTNDLLRRMIEHREGRIAGFTKPYKVNRLVHFEAFTFVEHAIQRERTLKPWRRDWKTNLIERDNPHWQDLFPGVQRLNCEAIVHGASGEMDPRDKPEDDRN